MGIVASALGGAGEGMMQAGRQLGDYASKSALQEEMAKIQASRDAILQEFQRSENALGRDLTREEGAAGRKVTQDEGAASRGLSRDLANQTDTRIREEGAAGRTHAERLATTHEAAATARHGQSMGVQKLQLEQALKIADMSRPLQQDADGNFFKMGEKGPAYITNEKGEKFKGPKDLSSRETKAADAILAQMKVVAADQTMDPAVKNATMSAYQSTLNTVLFGASGKPAKEPAARDPKTMNMSYGFVEPNTGAKWIGKPGDKSDDPKNWEMPKNGAKTRGIVAGTIKPPEE